LKASICAIQNLNRNREIIILYIKTETMPSQNLNPISLDHRPIEPTEYNVPQIYKNTMLYLTIKIQLLETGWQYASIHSISLKGSDIYPAKIPEPTGLKLDYPINLSSKKMLVTSHISRLRESSENDTPSRIKYLMKIEAGDVLLDEFIKESDTNNPSNFYSFIIINLLL